MYYDLLRRGFLKPEDLEPIIEGFEFYFDAFRELSTSRPVGLDLAPIPFTAIAEYFRIYELQDFDEFSFLIRVLDNTFLELNDKGAKQGDKNGSGNTDPKNSNQGGHPGKPGHPGPRK